MRRRLAQLIGVVVVLHAGTGVWAADREAVPTGGAALRTLADADSLDCLILPDKVASVGSQVEGILEEVLVRRGDVVKAGQVLARLESGVELATVELAKTRLAMQANLSSLDVQLAFARRRLERTEELFGRAAASSFEVDEAKTQEQQALYALEAAREEIRLSEVELTRSQAALALREIRSPIDGVVVEIYLFAGERVDREPVLKVARIDPLRVEVTAPVSAFGLIAIGTKAVVIPEAPLNGEYKATVIIVDKVLDAASGTFGIRLELPNPGFQLPGGLRCAVRFKPGL
jgi:RND family efflux transporter MFP subunit